MTESAEEVLAQQEADSKRLAVIESRQARIQQAITDFYEKAKKKPKQEKVWHE